MGMTGIFLRRARMRSLKEGQVQNVRVEALENDAKEQAERFQDYGFTGNPVDGQGLAMTIDGHTLVVRMDRLAERPHLNPFEVCMWHKDGHKVTMNNNSIVMHHLEGHEVSLKAGQLVQVDCQKYVVNASVSAKFNVPLFEHNGQTFTANASVSAKFNVPLFEHNGQTFTANASSGANLNTPLVQASNTITVANNCNVGGTTTTVGLSSSGTAAVHNFSASGTVSMPSYAPTSFSGLTLNGTTKVNGPLKVNDIITSDFTDIIVRGADLWVEQTTHTTGLHVGDPADPPGSGGSGGVFYVFVPTLFQDSIYSAHAGISAKVIDARHTHLITAVGVDSNPPT